MDGLIVEIDFCQEVHVMSQLWLDEVMGHHGIPEVAFEGDAIVGQHLHIVLDVLSDFQYRRIFVQWSENLHHLLCLLMIFGHGNVESLIFAYGETQSHQFCLDGVGRSGFRI